MKTESLTLRRSSSEETTYKMFGDEMTVSRYSKFSTDPITELLVMLAIELVDGSTGRNNPTTKSLYERIFFEVMQKVEAVSTNLLESQSRIDFDSLFLEKFSNGLDNAIMRRTELCNFDQAFDCLARNYREWHTELESTLQS